MLLDIFELLILVRFLPQLPSHLVNVTEIVVSRFCKMTKRDCVSALSIAKISMELIHSAPDDGGAQSKRRQYKVLVAATNNK